MRYRPLGSSGMVVSVISMSLVDSAARARPSDWTSLIYTALENGINAFEVVGRHPAPLHGLSDGLLLSQMLPEIRSQRNRSLPAQDGRIG